MFSNFKTMIIRKNRDKFLLFTLVMLSSSVIAQMYVSPNTSVYVNNQVVYIAQDLELNTISSNFYLRKESQLLQGNTGLGANKGVGSLSVFQEGTVNNYAYNYWCSPVGGNVAAAGNSLFGITQLGVPITTTSTSLATMLAMNNYDGMSGTGTLSIAPYWIWKFSVKDAYADWISVGSNSTIAAGEGFTMKGVSGSDATAVDGVITNVGSKQRYDFRGKPNDGTIDIPVALDQFTLTGNPYPSAIDLTMFLTDATNSKGIAYFWESDKTVNSHYLASYVGGYGTFSPVSRGGTGIYVSAVFESFDGAGNYIAPTGTSPNTNYERRFCPVGQGFMIEGNVAGTVQMNNSYRVYVKEGAANNSQFEKKRPGKNPIVIQSNFMPAILSVSGFDYTKVSKLPVPQIRFKTQMNKGMTLPMVLAFEPTATDDEDFAMDARSYNEDLDQEIYFGINDIPYIIDVVAFDVTKKIPLGFRNTAEAQYKITIDEILNFSLIESVYIHDKLADAYYDIKKNPFDITLPAGVNNTQFEITFRNSIFLGIDESVGKNFTVYQNNNSRNLTIENPKGIELKEIRVFDVTGKSILNKTKLGSDASYQYATSGWSDGVYIVKLYIADNQTESKKIIVINLR